MKYITAAVVAAFVPLVLIAQTPPTPASPTATAEVTFTKHIAPILQRSCENCHRGGGVAPMPLTTYEEVRPWAKAIKQRTAIGPHAGVMPPWYVEKNIGIQKFRNDPSLSDQEIAMIAKWADSGAPRGQRRRHAAGPRVERQQQVADRRARSGRAHHRPGGQGQRARLRATGRAPATARWPTCSSTSAIACR
jgi:hypothetical protein